MTEAIRGFEAEKIVRMKLAASLQVKFAYSMTERILVVAYRSTGKPVKHEFDLVSEDKRIIGEVKSYKYTKKAHSNTRLPRVGIWNYSLPRGKSLCLRIGKCTKS